MGPVVTPSGLSPGPPREGRPSWNKRKPGEVPKPPAIQEGICLPNLSTIFKVSSYVHAPSVDFVPCLRSSPDPTIVAFPSPSFRSPFADASFSSRVRLVLRGLWDTQDLEVSR